MKKICFYLAELNIYKSSDIGALAFSCILFNTNCN